MLIIRLFSSPARLPSPLPSQSIVVTFTPQDLSLVSFSEHISLALTPKVVVSASRYAILAKDSHVEGEAHAKDVESAKVSMLTIQVSNFSSPALTP